MDSYGLRCPEASEPPARVLLVGDQWDMLQPVLTALSSQGRMEFVYPPGQVASWQHVEEALSRTDPSVILTTLDFVGPRATMLQGWSKAQPSLPSILLCVTHESLETENLYEGADDFLVIPCSAAELDKRLRRLVWKNQSLTLSSLLRVGKITLDLDTYQVLLDGQRVELAWMEFQLLKFLMQNPGRVFTREHLLANVWGVDTFLGTRTVDVHIRRLRQKLGIHGDHYFTTVKNVGYGLIAPE